MKLLHRFLITITAALSGLLILGSGIKADGVTQALGPFAYDRQLEIVPASPGGYAGNLPAKHGDALNVLPLHILPSFFHSKFVR